MARPRIWVNRHGKPVKTNTGISFNKARRRFYIIRSDGKRQEFRTWEDARAGLATEKANSIPTEELARIAAVARYRSDLAHEALYGDARFHEILDEMTIGGPQIVQSVSHAEAVVGFAEAANTLADQVDVPRMKIGVDPVTPIGGPRLRDVIQKWKQHKVEEAGGRTTRHHGDGERLWGEFVKQVGNLFIAQLSPAHFRTFHSWVAREGAKHSPKWQGSRVAIVKGVLRFVRKRYPEWPWPVGILEWADSYMVRPYRSPAVNREPMPAKTFAALVEQCRTWTHISTTAHDATTQSGRAKRLQAIRTRRDGCQFEAILRLGLNCGLDPVDIERLTWNDLRLTAATPHMRFARRKIERAVGMAVERITPLLPSTVEAVERWRSGGEPHGEWVFRTARAGRYSRNRVAQTMKRLREESGVDGSWSFKHLRNVGPTLARRARLSNDEREAFLGHVVGGTSRFYEGDVDETYLIPLVDLIGEQYFDGEKVEAGPGGTIQ